MILVQTLTGGMIDSLYWKTLLDVSEKIEGNKEARSPSKSGTFDLKLSQPRTSERDCVKILRLFIRRPVFHVPGYHFPQSVELQKST